MFHFTSSLSNSDHPYSNGRIVCFSQWASEAVPLMMLSVASLTISAKTTLPRTFAIRCICKWQPPRSNVASVLKIEVESSRNKFPKNGTVNKKASIVCDLFCTQPLRKSIAESDSITGMYQRLIIKSLMNKTSVLAMAMWHQILSNNFHSWIINSVQPLQHRISSWSTRDNLLL